VEEHTAKAAQLKLKQLTEKLVFLKLSVKGPKRQRPVFRAGAFSELPVHYIILLVINLC